MQFFDLIFRRYASPLTLLDGMIRGGRLEEFVNEFVGLYNKEQEDETLWKIWLHRVFDQSYADFRASVKSDAKAAPTQEEVQSIVAESESILNAFLPACGEVNANGTVPAAGDDCG